MSVTHANPWDAARLLRELTDEQKERVKQQIAERKLLHVVFERPYNKALCRFVEGRLNR